MDGVGSRLGRSSSRYGATPGSTTLPVFTGPVRKWRRQWVTSQPTTTTSTRGKHQEARHLLLCRWIPVPSTGSADSDMPPKRKFRYAPVTVLEEMKKETCGEVGVDGKVSESEAILTVRNDAAFENSHLTDALLLNRKELMKDQAQVNQHLQNSRLFLDDKF